MIEFAVPYRFMDERCKRAVYDILSIFDGAPLCDIEQVLDCVKDVVERDSVWHYPKPEPEKNEIAELADKVAGQVAEAIKQLPVDKPPA